MAKQIIKFTAEHINKSTASKLIEELEAKRYNVLLAGMDPTFCNTLLLFVKCTDKQGAKIQQLVWDVNGGCQCLMKPITGDELEEYL